MSVNLSGNLSGVIDNMLEGSIAGGISLVTSSAVIESKTITENGTYTAPTGVDGYSPVIVNVPAPEPVIEPKSIFANGEYTAPEGVDGYSPVIVDVPSKIEKTLNVTSNGTYTPEEGTVYNSVVVNVSASPTIISSNDGKFKLGIVSINNDNELVLTFSDATINSIENMDIFTNQKLPNGIDKGTLRLCKAYDSPAQTNQIGFVGFYQNTLRAWNLDQSQNVLLENIYCSLFLSDTTLQQDNPYIEL